MKEALNAAIALPLWVAIFGALGVVFAVLALTRARGGWLAPLASLNCLLVAAEGIFLVRPELAPWRAQVLAMRLAELPSVTSVAATCLVQAGLLAWPRRGAMPFGEAAFRPALRRVLKAAPFFLFAAWLAALVGQLIWPVNAFDPFARWRPRDFFLLAPLCIPLMFYLALLGWLFGKAAGPSAHNRRLRAKNLSLSAGVSAYCLVIANVVVGYGVQAFAPLHLLRPITRAQLLIDDILFKIVLVGLPLGLALGTAPAAHKLLKRAYYPLMALRPKLEARRWQLAASGGLRRLTRALYHVDRAADLLGIPDLDREKTSVAVELLWVLKNEPEHAPELTAENMHRSLALQRWLLLEGPLASVMGPPKSLLRASEHPEDDVAADAARGPEGRPARLPPEDTFSDALEAAVALAGDSEDRRALPHEKRLSPWYQLAAVVAQDAEMIAALDRPTPQTEEIEQVWRRALRAYQAARGDAAGEGAAGLG